MHQSIQASMAQKIASYLDDEVRQLRQSKPTILEEMELGTSRDRATYILEGRYEVAHFFAELLQEVEGKLRKECSTVADAVHENYEEEMGIHGYGTTKGVPHEIGRKILMEAIGFDYKQWAMSKGSLRNIGSIHYSTRHLLQALLETIQKENPLVVAGMIGFYEWRISGFRKTIDSKEGYGEYVSLIKGMRQVFPQMSESTMQHLIDHAIHDRRHAEELFAPIIQTVRTRQDIQYVINGFDICKSAWNTYWQQRLSELTSSVPQEPSEVVHHYRNQM